MSLGNKVRVQLYKDWNFISRNGFILQNGDTLNFLAVSVVIFFHIDFNFRVPQGSKFDLLKAHKFF